MIIRDEGSRFPCLDPWTVRAGLSGDPAAGTPFPAFLGIELRWESILISSTLAISTRIRSSTSMYIDFFGRLSRFGH